MEQNREERAQRFKKKDGGQPGSRGGCLKKGEAGTPLRTMILIFPELWLILYLILLFSLIRCLILSQILSNKTKDTKYLNSLPKTLINPSILLKLILHGFGPVEVLYEMS